MISIPLGWIPLVLEYDRRLNEIDSGYIIDQVKEKFGGLCYYAHPSAGYDVAEDRSRDPFWETVSDLEEHSLSICEDCGEPGELRGGAWTICLCSECLSVRGDDRRIKRL